MREPLECLKCPHWKENIGKINSGFAIQQIHGFGGYTGRPVEYCPWCSEKLTKIKTEED